MQFRFGIEHEVAMLRSNGEFADFTNTTYAEFAAIVQALPEYDQDGQHLRFGDAGIRRKRWYVEGIERFDESGKLVACIPKGIEIRTTIHDSIAGVIEELTTSFNQLQEVAAKHGFTPILTSFNPQQTQFIPDPPLNQRSVECLPRRPHRTSRHAHLWTGFKSFGG
jgi:hypothetical protein